MRRALLSLVFALAASAAFAQIGPILSGVARPGQIIQNITSVAPTSFSYTTGIISGTAIGTVAATIAPPISSAAWTLSGASASDFTINSSTGVIAANGSTPTCSSPTPYSLNAVATDQNAYGSPYTQAITITCSPPEAAFVYYSVTGSSNLPGVGTAYYGPKLPPIEIVADSTIVVGLTINHGLTVTMSDTQGLSWTNVCNADGGSGNNITELWVASVGASPSSSTDAITASWGTTTSIPLQYVETVYANLATSSVTNNSKCTASITPTSGGVVDGGSFTPTTNNNANGGNVIWAYTAMCGGTGTSASIPSAYSFASGFTPLNGELGWHGNGSGVNFPTASQWEVQTTQAAVDPTFTMTGETAGGDCFNLATVALKVNNNGSAAPSAIHVAGITHESNVNQAGATGDTVLWPTTGNLRVITMGWEGGSPNSGATTVSSVTSSDTCGGSSAFTEIGPLGGGSVLFYQQNCSANPNLTISIAYAGGGTVSQSSWKEYDVANALSSSYQNSAGNSGTCPNGTNVNMPSITPTGASSGIAIAEIGLGTGPSNGGGSVTAPTGAIFDALQYTDGSDADMSDNDDGSGHVYFSSTAAQSWSWTQTGGTSTCFWIAGVFD